MLCENPKKEKNTTRFFLYDEFKSKHNQKAPNPERRENEQVTCSNQVVRNLTYV